MKARMKFKKMAALLTAVTFFLSYGSPALATVTTSTSDSSNGSEGQTNTTTSEETTASVTSSSSTTPSSETTADTTSTPSTNTTSSTTSSSTDTTSTTTSTTTASSSSTTTSSSQVTVPSSSTATSSSQPATTPSSVTPPATGNAGATVTTPAGQTDQASSNATQTTGDASSDALAEVKEADSLTVSSLNDFELPVKSSLKNDSEAALIAGALKQLSKNYVETGATAPDTFDQTSLIPYLYQTIFNVALPSDYAALQQSGIATTLETLKIGDLIFWNNHQQVGLYLGQNKYIFMDYTAASTKDKDNHDVNQKVVKIGSLPKESTTDTDKTTKKVAGLTDLGKPDQYLHITQNLLLTDAGSDLVTHYAATTEFKVNAQTQKFIAEIGNAARELGQKYDVYASVMIAQAILETGSGSSQLSSSPYYNLFGIKGDYNGNSVTFNTSEDSGNGSLYQISSSFRSYPSVKESLSDYVALLKKGVGSNQDFYKPTWRSEAKNYLQATAYLTGKYATDTKYNDKLNSLIATYHLTQYDNEEDVSGDAAGLVALAKTFIGSPYVWGGKGPTVFDCSGFTSYIYRNVLHKEIGSWTVPQEDSDTVIAVSEAKAGDLYFWGSKGATYHVALATGNGNYIAAGSPATGVTTGSASAADFPASFAVRVK